MSPTILLTHKVPDQSFLIAEVEAFLKEREGKCYLLPSSRGILAHELILAKKGQPNELNIWYPKFKAKLETNKTKILTEISEKEAQQYELYQNWKGTKTELQIDHDFKRLQARFNTLSQKQLYLTIGSHIQRKYRIQNQLNDIVKIMNIIECGLRKDRKKIAINHGSVK